jgi:hypothetical protein
VKAEGRVARRGSTVAEALRPAPVAPRRACDVRGGEDELVSRGKNGGESVAHQRKGWWQRLRPNSVVRR